MQATLTLSRECRESILSLWNQLVAEHQLNDFPAGFKYCMRECYLMQINELLNNVIMTSGGRSLSNGARSLLDISEAFTFVDSFELELSKSEVCELASNGNSLARLMLGVWSAGDDDYVCGLAMSHAVGEFLPHFDLYADIESTMSKCVGTLGLYELDCYASIKTGLNIITISDYDAKDLEYSIALLKRK